MVTRNERGLGRESGELAVRGRLTYGYEETLEREGLTSGGE